MYYVYIMANWNNKVIYIGLTNDLARRVYEHKNKITESFTSKYNINKLVYVEEYKDVNSAISREKQLKKWSRNKKNSLIEGLNPQWIELEL